MNPEHLCMACMEDAGEAAFCPSCGADRNQPAASLLHLPPRTVLHDQYLLGRVLGQGGFGITYIAWDLNLARRLAVKEYLPGGVATRTSGARTIVPYSGQAQQDFEWGLEKFLEEARVIARFQNFPGIVAVLNFFRENGTAYLVMEYLEGVTLDEYLKRKGGTISPDWAVRVMMPVMDALREVHKAGVLHRDISPDNVYLSHGGQVKVLDFGAARYALSEHSRNLSVILKEGYAPEEQYRTKGNQGPWTDVYATAATMYRAITGRVPQPALDRRESDEVVPPSALGIETAPHVEAALMKALAIRAGDRFQSMEDFQAALTDEQAVVAAVSEPGVAPVPAEQGTQPPAEETKPMRAPLFDAGETRPLVRVPPAGDETKAFVRPRDLEETKPLPILPAPPPPAPVPPPRKMLPVWMMAAIAAIAGLAGYVAFKSKKSGTAAAPVIESFSAQPARTISGQPVILSWRTSFPADVVLDPGNRTFGESGSVTVKPEDTTTYRLSARNKNGIVNQSVTVEVSSGGPPPPPPQPEPGPGRLPEPDPGPVRETAVNPRPEPAIGGARILSFDAEPSVVRAGQSVVLHWSVERSGHTSITPGIGVVKPQGSVRLSPRESQTYALMAQGSDGKQTVKSVYVEVAPEADNRAPMVEAAGAEIVRFDARPDAIGAGQRAMLQWSVRGATSVTIEPGIGAVATSGTRMVSPNATTNYTLTARGAGPAPVSAETSVQVMGRQAGAYNQGSDSGRAAFSASVMHDHGGAIGGALGSTRVLGRVRPNLAAGACNGELKIAGQNIQFQSQGGHSFNYPLSEITEVRENRMSIQGNPAFHIRFQDGANYNFVPRSSDVTRVVGAIGAARAGR